MISSPHDVVAERFERLRVVVERSALAKHHARIGRVEEVLVEGPSKKDPSVTTGRTRQNKLVHFAPPAATPLRPGTFADVRGHATRAAPPARRTRHVTAAAASPHAHPGAGRLSEPAVLFIPLFDELSEPSVAIDIAVGPRPRAGTACSCGTT